MTHTGVKSLNENLRCPARPTALAHSFPISTPSFPRPVLHCDLTLQPPSPSFIPIRIKVDSPSMLVYTLKIKKGSHHHFSIWPLYLVCMMFFDSTHVIKG